MPETPPRAVFVSHAHADNELCDRYVAALRERGLDVWYDRTNMQDGHMLSAAIERELERRSAFVVLLTPASVASYWVNLEVSAFRSLAALDPTRLMLPVRIAECKVPLLMTGIKWVDAVSLGFEAAVDAMAVALGAPVAPTPQPTESVNDLLAAGIALLNQRKPDEAIPFFERATKLDPRSFDAWANLGLAYNETGRHGDDLAAYERALALDDTQAWVWNNKGSALLGLNRRDEALVAMDRALALDPTLAFAWSNKGNALDSLGRFEEAMAACDRALDLDPNLASAWFYKGYALDGLKCFEEALTAYDRALDLDPTFVSVWNFKGEALGNLGCPEEALAAFDRALEYDPNDGWAWGWKCTLLRVLGRYEEAEVAFQRKKETGWGEPARATVP